MSDHVLHPDPAVCELIARAQADALTKAADAIDAWQEIARWAASHTEDPDSAQNSMSRALAYRRAARIVRTFIPSIPGPVSETGPAQTTGDQS